jgi:beta-glucosidase
MRISTSVAVSLLSGIAAAQNYTNSTTGAIYKDPSANIEARVEDLLSRMTLEDKVAQLMQGDISNWINTTTNAFNLSGLITNMATKAGQFYVGYPVPQQWIAEGIKKAQVSVMIPFKIPHFNSGW